MEDGLHDCLLEFPCRTLCAVIWIRQMWRPGGIIALQLQQAVSKCRISLWDRNMRLLPLGPVLGWPTCAAACAHSLRQFAAFPFTKKNVHLPCVIRGNGNVRTHIVCTTIKWRYLAENFFFCELRKIYCFIFSYFSTLRPSLICDVYNVCESSQKIFGNNNNVSAYVLETRLWFWGRQLFIVV